MSVPGAIEPLTVTVKFADGAWKAVRPLSDDAVIHMLRHLQEVPNVSELCATSFKGD
jgi:hypothetical protein